MTDEKLVCPYCGNDSFIRKTTDTVEILSNGEALTDDVIGDTIPSLIDAEYEFQCDHCKMGIHDGGFVSKKEAEFALIVTIDSDDRPNTEILYSADTVEKVKEVMNLLATCEFGYFNEMKDSAHTKEVIGKLNSDYGIAWFDAFSTEDNYVPEIKISRIVRLETVKQL